MAFDFKKEYKEFYMPPKTPTVVTVPPMNFLTRFISATLGRFPQRNAGR